MDNIKRGDVFYANLDPVVGSEQGGIRPILILQNDIGNKYAPTIVAAITSKSKKGYMPTHVNIDLETIGLPKDSVVMLEQIRTLDKSRLREYIGRMDNQTMLNVEKAFKVSVGMTN